jgi:cell division septal protein FtsQ
MTLSKDNRPNKPEQNRTQKIVMWSIYAVAAVLLVVAVVVFFASGSRLF